MTVLSSFLLTLTSTCLSKKVILKLSVLLLGQTSVIETSMGKTSMTEISSLLLELVFSSLGGVVPLDNFLHPKLRISHFHLRALAISRALLSSVGLTSWF